MTASNHAITGAVIALTIHSPLLALPLAFLSHFILDALPHFGFEGHVGFRAAFKHRVTVFILIFDVISWLILFYLLLGQPAIIYLAGLIAVSPDFVWLSRYFFFERKNLEPPSPSWFTRFHQDIQWGERPWGVVFELTWFAGMITVLIRLIG